LLLKKLRQSPWYGFIPSLFIYTCILSIQGANIWRFALHAMFIGIFLVGYFISKPTLLDKESKHLKRVKGLLMEEVDLDLKSIETREKDEQYLRKKIEHISRRYRIKMEKETLDKLMYYVSKDFVHYGKIDPLMRDHISKTYLATASGFSCMSGIGSTGLFQPMSYLKLLRNSTPSS